MGCIYKITNTINGKLYIGYTTRLIKERMRRHKTDDYKTGTLLGRAINKYGWENFVYEVILEEEDKEKLLELEQYYIKKFNSLKPNGYNMTIGGEKLYGENNPFYGHTHTEETKQKLSELAKQRTGESNPFYGHTHTEETKQKIREANSKAIAMLDENKNIVQIFESGAAAGRWLREQNITKNESANSSIVKAIKKNQRAYGYYWKYLKKSVEAMGDECSPVGQEN